MMTFPTSSSVEKISSSTVSSTGCSATPTSRPISSDSRRSLISIVKTIIPQPDYTGPADASTLLRRYTDNRLKEGLRLPAPTPLPSDVKKLKRICFRNCPLAESKELSQAIDARQQSIDILQLHGNVRILTLPHEHIPLV